MKKLVVLLFSFCFCIYAQVQPVVPDFLISGEENIPSLFQKFVPDIIYSDSARFIACWNDYREGTLQVYAQELDYSGSKTGRNFKIPSPAISCNSNNYKLTLDHIFSESVFGTEHMVYADLYNPAGEKISRYDFYYNVLPECGTGYISGEIKIASSDEAFYLYCNEGGDDYLVKLKPDGNATVLRSSRYALVTEIAVTATRNSDVLCAWVKGEEDTISPGLYTSFYNSDDSIINPAVKISDLKNMNNYWGYLGNCALQAVTLTDSTYKIFWFNALTKVLYSAMVNTRGEILSPEDSLAVIIEGNNVSMKVSCINDGHFVVYLQPEIPAADATIFIKYNLKGEIVSQPPAAINLNYNRNLYYTGNDKYYFMSADTFNIFMEEYDGGVTGEKIKVNDDECGSNEINYNIVAYGTNEAAAIWSNEAHTFIRLIKADGTMGTVKIDPEDKNIKFFRNKTGISGWTKIDDQGRYYAGYSVYDENFNVVSRKNVVEGISLVGTAPQINIISDNEFIFSLDTEEGVELYKISSGGNILKNAFIEFNTISKNHTIYPDTNNFWICRGEKFVKITNDFEKENLSYEITNMPALYIGNNRFLYLRYDYNPYLGVLTRVAGVITDEKSDTLKTFYLAGDASNFRVHSLPGGRFIAIRKIPYGYNAAVYNNNGDESASSCSISNNQTASINYIAAVMNDDKLYFTWSDYVEEGKGYNVYGSIYNSDELVSVKLVSPQLPVNYSLLQNYPNPFNPVTNIEFDVAVSGFVTIKIYDILGREVTTLVNEEKSPGRYKAEFNASSFSSGTYFCRMNINDYSSVMKMILLK